MNVPYLIAVEPQELDKYAEVIDRAKILVLPFSDLGAGSYPARNYCWQHAIESGATRHWMLDDNIENFHRLNRNAKPVVTSGTIFRIAEDFVERYENVPLAGFNYYSFCKTTDSCQPVTFNTRIYSCMLIDNSLEFDWRAKYNEDTDLSLRVLKAGYCTIQFNAFLAGKVTTQRMSGGNTKEFYSHERTLNKSQMLVDLHPDVSKVVWKFNRWHHKVDYSSFKNNKLIRKEGLIIPARTNNYGMKLVNLKGNLNECDSS